MNNFWNDLLSKATETKLSPVDEVIYKKWKQENAPGDSGYDYDFRGAFAAGVTPDPATKHWPDTFKKPNHPTYSIESQYAVPGLAGSWDGETFVPGIGQGTLKSLLGVE